jgi:putative flippase GtrA
MVARDALTAEKDRRRETLPRLALFVAFGILSSAAYLATMVACVDVLGFPVVPSSVAAFVVGTLVSYVLNTRFTYRDRMNWANFNRFALVVLIGFGLNVAITWIFARLGVHYVIGALVVFVVVPAFNFLAHSRFTYGAGRAP